MLLSTPARTVSFGRTWKIVVWLLAGICACAAVYLFIVCTLSFDTLRAMALSAVPPGYEDRFTPALYQKIIGGLRLSASTLLLLSIVFVTFSGRLSSFLMEIWRDLEALGRNLIHRVREAASDRLHFVALLAVVLGAAILRLVFLNEPIRKDESYTFMYSASRPVYVGLTYYT